MLSGTPPARPHPMRKRSLYQVVILGIIAILAAFALQGYWLWSAYQLKSQEFDQQVKEALLAVAQGFEEQSGISVPDIDLINPITANYYVVNLNASIDANDLEYLLRRELEAVGLTEAFDYGIYDCYTDKMVYGDYVSYRARPDSVEQADLLNEELPTYDEYIYYFGVRFPDHASSLLASLGAVSTLGGVLLVTVLFFAYATWVLVRQQQLGEMQKDFINNMTHEFKTPLSTIKVAAGVLQRAGPIQADARLARYADIVASQNERLTEQVEKVLQLARIERNRFELQKEPIDLNELVVETCDGPRAKIEELGGTLSLKLGANGPHLPADRMHLSGAISALLDNAVKYSPEAPQITVCTENTPAGFRVTVADEGIGIPVEQHSKVFEKFYRVPTGNVHDVKGFGLGLFYVGGVCRAHGYELSLESDRKRGAAFRIDIPELRERSLPAWRRWSLRIFGADKRPGWTQM